MWKMLENEYSKIDDTEHERTKIYFQVIFEIYTFNHYHYLHSVVLDEIVGLQQVPRHDQQQ